MKEPKTCNGCRGGEPLPFPFTMAFHPIVDIKRQTIWGYEALVRGITGQSAAEILGQVNEANRYQFDQACRVKAVQLASRLFPNDGELMLAINFMPNAVYEPRACIRATLDAAHRVQFDPKRIMFEFTENERIADVQHIARIVDEYKMLGFITAIDDFGSGFAGLNLLVKFQPDVVKIDMEMVRGVDMSSARQAIIAGVMSIARALQLQVIAEGIETEAELSTLRQAGIELCQGFLFAKPAIEALPPVSGMSVS